MLDETVTIVIFNIKFKRADCSSRQVVLSCLTEGEGHWEASGGRESKERSINVRERNLGCDVNVNPESVENWLCAFGCIICLLKASICHL